jgi:hypothetical protein
MLEATAGRRSVIAGRPRRPDGRNLSCNRDAIPCGVLGASFRGGARDEAHRHCYEKLNKIKAPRPDMQSRDAFADRHFRASGFVEETGVWDRKPSSRKLS